jgi:hypothetical protein
LDRRLDRKGVDRTSFAQYVKSVKRYVETLEDCRVIVGLCMGCS